MHLYETLSKYQKNREHYFHNSDEILFFNKNKLILMQSEQYKKFVNINDEFDAIRANIIIKALQNKEILDKKIQEAYKSNPKDINLINNFVHREIENRPYLLSNGNKIYLPIFNRIINEIYYSDCEKLFAPPYDSLFTSYDSLCIDLFDTYGFELYNSLFTKLIAIKKTEKFLMAYHFDFNTIYIINDQGRLEAKISLFDRYIKNPYYDHIIDRIKPVIEAYENNDRNALYNALIDNNLISGKLIYKIKHKELKFRRKLEKTK